MIIFKLAPHTRNVGDVVEIWDHQAGFAPDFIGAIYPSDSPAGMSIVCKRLKSPQQVKFDYAFPTKVEIVFNGQRTGEEEQ